MKHDEARRRAADAIRAACATDEVFRVVEVDGVTERDVPILADGIDDATLAESGERGPAVVAVMARGRTETQAIELTAYTIIRSRLAIELTMAGRGRGVAIVDQVEGALSNLPPHGLPRLFVTSSVAPLPPTVRDDDDTVYVYWSRCVWPPADPDAPLAGEAGGAMDAIRDHVATAVAAGLPAAGQGAVTDAQVGALESHRRLAVIEAQVPRAGIDLSTRRETRGGEFDLATRSDQEWTDSDGRQWIARVAEQEVVVTVAVYHRTEPLADEAISRIMGELDDTVVSWPGSFDVREFDTATNAMVTRRRTGGQYEQKVLVLNRNPATWDAEAGLAMAAMQATVQSITQLAPATEKRGPVRLQHEATFRVPLRGG